MSNWKHAYGWSGHILTSTDETKGNADDNLVAIAPDKFAAIVEAHENCKMDKRIEYRQLGVTANGEVRFIATGTCFSEGFTHYGTVFEEAEVRQDGDVAIDHDAEYLKAMKDIYGLDLPPCRLMIGCSSEH